MSSLTLPERVTVLVESPSTWRHPARCLLTLLWSISQCLSLALTWPTVLFRTDLRARPLSSFCSWGTLKSSPGVRTRAQVRVSSLPWDGSLKVRHNLYRNVWGITNLNVKHYFPQLCAVISQYTIAQCSRWMKMEKGERMEKRTNLKPQLQRTVTAVSPILKVTMCCRTSVTHLSRLCGDIQGVSKKRYFLGFRLILVWEVVFYFLVYVLESECWARFIYLIWLKLFGCK